MEMMVVTCSSFRSKLFKCSLTGFSLGRNLLLILSSFSCVHNFYLSPGRFRRWLPGWGAPLQHLQTASVAIHYADAGKNRRQFHENRSPTCPFSGGFQKSRDSWLHCPHLNLFLVDVSPLLSYANASDRLC